MQVWSRRLANTVLDRAMDTSEYAVELDHFHPERTWYLPSDWRDMRRALRGIEVGPTDVFVDFGSGKGRMLYQAARYPFGRVIGVEISDRLTEIARENIEKNRHKLRCQRIELVTADAVDFAIPDDMTVAYFYHPFSGDTFKNVIDHVVRSLDRRPRRLTIIYQIPLMEEHLLSTGRFEVLRTVKYRPDDPRRMTVYQSRPASPPVSTG
jgi:precorrin-6B methylase 2